MPISLNGWIVNLGGSRDSPIGLMVHNGKLTLMVTKRLGKRETLCHVDVTQIEALRFARGLVANRFTCVSEVRPMTGQRSGITYNGGSVGLFEAQVNTLKTDFFASAEDVIGFGKAILAKLNPTPQPVPAPIKPAPVKRDVLTLLQPAAPSTTPARIAGQPSYTPAPGPLT
jgi:hypothetical protein